MIFDNSHIQRLCINNRIIVIIILLFETITSYIPDTPFIFITESRITVIGP